MYSSIYRWKLKYIFIAISLISLITGKDVSATESEKDITFGRELNLAENEINDNDSINSNSININEAIEIALNHNLKIAAERKRHDKAGAQLQKASQLFPSNPKIESEIGSRSSRQEKHTDYSISLSQELELFGQRGQRIQVAKKGIEGVRFQIKDVERRIIDNVKSLFFQALTAQENVKLQSRAADIFKRLCDATKERYKAGAISALELNTIQIQYGLVKQRLLTVENDFQQSLLDLKFSIGQESERPLNITGNLSYKPVHLKYDDLLTLAFDNRPDLKAANLENERASSQISLRKREIIPNPELSGFFDHEEGTDQIVGGKISISIPIWDRKQSELKKARAVKDIAGINIENKQMQIQNEVESAYRSFTAAVQSIIIFDNEIIPHVDENLKLNEISYSEGKINFVEFLTVQNSLIETKAVYLNALLNYNKSIINLETVTGVSIGG